MKKINILLIAALIMLTTSSAFASLFQNKITTAKTNDKMLFLLCTEPNDNKAKRINNWVKSKEIRLSDKLFDYQVVTMNSKEAFEELMMSFSISDNDKGPFVCITDQNGNEFMIIKGLKDLNTYKKAVKLAKKKYKEVKTANMKKKKEKKKK